MATPRIFVSSTYYDLRHIRKGIELFISELGYDSILFESGDIPFSHDLPLDASCYKEIGSSHILVLIIGGRYGSATSELKIILNDNELERHYQHYNSITQKELETALDEDIPVYIFVEKGVAAEYLTYKENRDNKTIRYAHVDSVNIFRLLDFIYARERNNLTKDFENLEDITSWLKAQWAGLFGDFLSKRSKEKTLQTLQAQLSSLKNVAETLKDYSENIIREVSPTEAEKIITQSKAKLDQQDLKDKLNSYQLIEHLIKHHSMSLDKLKSIFSKARSLHQLKLNLIGNSAPPSDCVFVNHYFHDNGGLKEINLIRATLSVPPLEPARRLGPKQPSLPRGETPPPPPPDRSGGTGA
ncbi:DUF4062 domain-containing protein [Luteolibacter rhizosphaerae]|nr:DUF4062 domain-containing protein [Luteolibacter rhizosphaerae]